MVKYGSAMMIDRSGWEKKGVCRDEKKKGIGERENVFQKRPGEGGGRMAWKKGGGAVGERGHERTKARNRGNLCCRKKRKKIHKTSRRKGSTVTRMITGTIVGGAE